MRKKPLVSIILVHYKAVRELLDCLGSIEDSNPTSSYQVIVVDQDERPGLENTIRKQFPNAAYLKRRNKGFGSGNNRGGEMADGKYLFFLNPDTLVFPRTIDALIDCIRRNRRAAIAAPLLLNEDKSVYELQGSRALTPFRAMVCLSFINRMFPNNPISRHYFLRDWNKKKAQEVDVVPGTAFMMRADVFSRVGGFDENIFMYFEESDLCRRVRDLGYYLYITPSSRIIHLGARSTHDTEKSRKHFMESRFYYFRKHFGLGAGAAVEGFLRFYKIFFLMILTAILYLLVILIQ